MKLSRLEVVTCKPLLFWNIFLGAVTHGFCVIDFGTFFWGVVTHGYLCILKSNKAFDTGLRVDVILFNCVVFT
jgi:hypothetical protein